MTYTDEFLKAGIVEAFGCRKTLEKIVGAKEGQTVVPMAKPQCGCGRNGKCPNA